MSCKGACAHANVRCAVPCVRAKSFLKSVRDVRLIFGRAMCDHIFSHFWNKIAIKLSENLFQNIQSRFRTSFPALEHHFLFKNIKNVEKLLKKYRDIAENFLIYQKCAGARCDPFKLEVRTRVRADLNLDVRGACVRRKKRSQLTPCLAKDGSGGQFVVLNSRIESSNNWRMPYLFYYQIMNPK